MKRPHALLSLALPGFLALATAALSGCAFSKQSTTTPGTPASTNAQGVITPAIAPVTTTVEVLNTNLFQAELTGLRVVVTPLLAYAVGTNQTLIPALQDAQLALCSLGPNPTSNPSAVLTAAGLRDPALATALAPSIAAVQQIEAKWLVPALSKSAYGQASVMLAQTLCQTITAVLPLPPASPAVPAATPAVK